MPPPIIGAASCCMMLLLGAPPAASDGFTYPGQSAEARQYNRRWDEFMRNVPALPATGDRALNEVEWMVGTWTAQPREFPSSMTDEAGAQPGSPVPASIDWTGGRKWLHIRFVAEPWHAEWDYFLGHDPTSHRWVLHYLAGPSLFLQPSIASGWRGDRLQFNSTSESYKGFRSIHRFVVVHTAADSFRIVNEIRMPSGKFVAMDDVLFTRLHVKDSTAH